MEHSKFPDYIYSPDTGYLYITKSNQKFIEESEYVDGPKKFSNSQDAKKWLERNNHNGILGVRFN